MRGGRVVAVAAVFAAVAGLALAADACGPARVEVLYPVDGSVIPSLPLTPFRFKVHCAAFPGDVVIKLWDLTTLDAVLHTLTADANVQMYLEAGACVCVPRS
jgi:hypothetical protein